MINPQKFGLNSRTKIEQISPEHLAIVVRRSSRIIMKDGVALLDKFEKIFSQNSVKLSLKTTAPVCSKTHHLLTEHGIGIIEIEE